MQRLPLILTGIGLAAVLSAYHPGRSEAESRDALP